MQRMTDNTMDKRTNNGHHNCTMDKRTNNGHHNTTQKRSRL